METNYLDRPSVVEPFFMNFGTVRRWSKHVPSCFTCTQTVVVPCCEGGVLRTDFLLALSRQRIGVRNKSTRVAWGSNRGVSVTLYVYWTKLHYPQYNYLHADACCKLVAQKHEKSAVTPTATRRLNISSLPSPCAAVTRIADVDMNFFAESVH